MVLVFPRPSRPARLTAALLGALLLSAPLTDAQARAPQTRDSRAPDVRPATPPPLPAPAVRAGQPGDSPELRLLYRRAADAARSHEQARRQADRQRRTAERLADAVREKRREYGELRKAVGSVAATQYRGSVEPRARLILADDPEDFLARTASLRQGDRAARRMVDTLAASRAELDDRRAAADRALRTLEDRRRTQLRLRQRVQADLVRAERRAARQALAARRAAQQWEAAGQGPAAPPAPVTYRGGCPTGTAPASAAGQPAGWVAPVAGGYRLTAGFAAQGGRWASGHTGLDFAVPTGTPVRAVGAGTVVRVGCGDSYGVQVVVRHTNGYHTQYAHLSQLRTAPGRQVRTGQQIGLSGSTGNSSGPHLHFEVRVTEQSGSAVDPARWLRDRGVAL